MSAWVASIKTHKHERHRLKVAYHVRLVTFAASPN